MSARTSPLRCSSSCCRRLYASCVTQMVSVSVGCVMTSLPLRAAPQALPGVKHRDYHSIRALTHAQDAVDRPSLGLQRDVDADVFAVVCGYGDGLLADGRVVLRLRVYGAPDGQRIWPVYVERDVDPVVVDDLVAVQLGRHRLGLEADPRRPGDADQHADGGDRRPQ